MKRAIELGIHIDAPMAGVWEAWTRPERFRQWFADHVTGEVIAGNTLTWAFDGFGALVFVDVLACEAPARLLLGGAMPAGGRYELELRFVERDGGTDLRLTHTGLPEGAAWEEDVEGMASGWTIALATLRRYLERYRGREKARVRILQPARYGHEQLRPFYRDEQALRRWLTRAGGIGAVGEPVELTLSSGAPLHGRVLADTGREVVVSWEEVGGVLALKALPLGPGARALGIDVVGWELDAGRAAELDAELGAALLRLAGLLR